MPLLFDGTTLPILTTQHLAPSAANPRLRGERPAYPKPFPPDFVPSQFFFSVELFHSMLIRYAADVRGNVQLQQRQPVHPTEEEEDLRGQF
jgi:hypothetical protein